MRQVETASSQYMLHDMSMNNNNNKVNTLTQAPEGEKGGSMFQNGTLLYICNLLRRLLFFRL